MPRQGKNRKPFKSNMAWVIPGVRLDCRKWESHGFISSTKDCRKVIFHEGNLADFFFCHKHGVGFTDGENGSWLCNNGNFMWEQPAKKRKKVRGYIPLTATCFHQLNLTLVISRAQTADSWKWEGGRKRRKVFMGVSESYCVKYLCKSKVKDPEHYLLLCWDPLF